MSATKRSRRQPTLALAKLIKRDDGRCHICGQQVDTTVKWNEAWAPTRDHVIPLADGGSHKATNLALAHLACNQARGDVPLPLDKHRLDRALARLRRSRSPAR